MLLRVQNGTLVVADDQLARDLRRQSAVTD